MYDTNRIFLVSGENFDRVELLLLVEAVEEERSEDEGGYGMEQIGPVAQHGGAWGLTHHLTWVALHAHGDQEHTCVVPFTP